MTRQQLFDKLDELSFDTEFIHAKEPTEPEFDYIDYFSLETEDNGLEQDAYLNRESVFSNDIPADLLLLSHLTLESLLKKHVLKPPVPPKDTIKEFSPVTFTQDLDIIASGIDNCKDLLDCMEQMVSEELNQVQTTLNDVIKSIHESVGFNTYIVPATVSYRRAAGTTKAAAGRLGLGRLGPTEILGPQTSHPDSLRPTGGSRSIWQRN